jgi:hypothetical protein
MGDQGFLSQIIDNTMQEGVNILNKGQTAIANEFVNSIEHFVPGLDNLSNEDAKAQFSKKAGRIGDIMKDLATDAKVQTMFIETGEAFSKLTNDLLDAFGPGITQLTEKGTELVSDLVENTGRALAKSGVDAVMSVIGEIPALGGIVDLGVTAFVVFNGIARNIKVAAKNLTQMGTIANKLTGNVLLLEDDGIEVARGLQKIHKAIKHDITQNLDKLDKEKAQGVGQDSAPTPDSTPTPAPTPASAPDPAVTGGSKQQSGGSTTATDSTADTTATDSTADSTTADTTADSTTADSTTTDSTTTDSTTTDSTTTDGTDNRADSPSDHHYGDKRPYCPWYGPCAIDKLIQEHEEIKLHQIVANQKLMQTLETHQHQQLQTTLANQEHHQLEQKKIQLQTTLANKEHQQLETTILKLQKTLAEQEHQQLEHQKIQLQEILAEQQHEQLETTVLKLQETLAEQQHEQLEHQKIQLQEILAEQQHQQLPHEDIKLQETLVEQETLAEQQHQQLPHEDIKLQQIVAKQQQYKLETTKFTLLQKLKLLLQQILAENN